MILPYTVFLHAIAVHDSAINLAARAQNLFITICSSFQLYKAVKQAERNLHRTVVAQCLLGIVARSSEAKLLLTALLFTLWQNDVVNYSILMSLFACICSSSEYSQLFRSIRRI